MLLAENQVIERNIEHLPAGNILLVDLLEDNALQEFATQRPDISWFGYTPFFDTWQRANNNQVFFSPWLSSTQTHDTKFDAVIIYYPKTKLRFDYYLSMISKLLNENATLYVVGEKKGGVKSCEKQIKSYSPKANKLDAARHCQLYTAWFNGSVCSKQMADWYQVKTVDIEIDSKSVNLDLYSLPGVFSANGVDEGTKLLLQTIEPVSGKGLDFGCGCGVISATIGKHFGCELTAIDVDALAVASSNKTFEINNINAKAVASNGLSEVLKPTKAYDFIVTNPPFHTGLKTDYGITELLLKQSSSILKKRFQYWMVANAFLPYPDLFMRYIKPVVIKNKNKRFNIYHCKSTI